MIEIIMKNVDSEILNKMKIFFKNKANSIMLSFANILFLFLFPVQKVLFFHIFITLSFLGSFNSF